MRQGTGRQERLAEEFALTAFNPKKEHKRLTPYIDAVETILLAGSAIERGSIEPVAAPADMPHFEFDCCLE